LDKRKKYEISRKKVRKKEPSDLDKRKKYEKSHKLAEKSVSKKKR